MPNSPRIVRGVPDNTFIVCRNQHTTTIGHGDTVIWIVTGDTTAGTPRTINGVPWLPGVDVKPSNAAGSGLTVGVAKINGALATASVAQGEYFTVQVGGYHAYAKTNTASLATGVVLQSDAAGGLIVADAGAATDIPKRRIAICIQTGGSGGVIGVANRAGVMIRAQ